MPLTFDRLSLAKLANFRYGGRKVARIGDEDRISLPKYTYELDDNNYNVAPIFTTRDISAIKQREDEEQQRQIEEQKLQAQRQKEADEQHERLMNQAILKGSDDEIAHSLSELNSLIESQQINPANDPIYGNIYKEQVRRNQENGLIPQAEIGPSTKPFLSDKDIENIKTQYFQFQSLPGAGQNLTMSEFNFDPYKAIEEMQLNGHLLSGIQGIGTGILLGESVLSVPTLVRSLLNPGEVVDAAIGTSSNLSRLGLLGQTSEVFGATTTAGQLVNTGIASAFAAEGINDLINNPNKNLENYITDALEIAPLGSLSLEVGNRVLPVAKDIAKELSNVFSKTKTSAKELYENALNHIETFRLWNEYDRLQEEIHNTQNPRQTIRDFFLTGPDGKKRTKEEYVKAIDGFLTHFIPESIANSSNFTDYKEAENRLLTWLFREGFGYMEYNSNSTIAELVNSIFKYKRFSDNHGLNLSKIPYKNFVQLLQSNNIDFPSSSVYEIINHNGKVAINFKNTGISYNLNTGKASILNFRTGEVVDFDEATRLNTKYSSSMFDINGNNIQSSTNSSNSDLNSVYVDDDYVKLVQDNLDYLEELFDGSKAIGSSVYPGLGVPHIVNDYDRIITKSKLDELSSKFKFKQNTNNPWLYDVYLYKGKDQTLRESSKIQFNVLENDPKTGKVKQNYLSEQIFRHYYPKESSDLFVASKLKKIQSYNYTGKHVDFEIPYTAEELMEKYDPVTNSIIDLLESEKDKQKIRSLAVLAYSNPGKMSDCINAYGYYLFGDAYYTNISKYLPNFNFTNIEENANLLRRMGYPEDIVEFCSDKEEAVRNLFTYYYIEQCGVFRNVGNSQTLNTKLKNIDDVGRAMTQWIGSNVGGSWQGGLINSTVGKSDYHQYAYIGGRYMMPIDLSSYRNPTEALDQLQYSAGVGDMHLRDIDKAKITTLPDDKKNGSFREILSYMTPNGYDITDNLIRKFGEELKSCGIFGLQGYSQGGYGIYRSVVNDLVDPSEIIYFDNNKIGLFDISKRSAHTIKDLSFEATAIRGSIGYTYMQTRNKYIEDPLQIDVLHNNVSLGNISTERVNRLVDANLIPKRTPDIDLRKVLKEAQKNPLYTENSKEGKAYRMKVQAAIYHSDPYYGSQRYHNAHARLAYKLHKYNLDTSDKLSALDTQSHDVKRRIHNLKHFQLHRPKGLYDYLNRTYHINSNLPKAGLISAINSGPIGFILYNIYNAKQAKKHKAETTKQNEENQKEQTDSVPKTKKLGGQIYARQRNTIYI